MSTGADCQIREVAANQWHYTLQCYPYGATEKYDKYGPFPTEQDAIDHLSDNHANPGGWCSSSFREDETEEGPRPSRTQLGGDTMSDKDLTDSEYILELAKQLAFIKNKDFCLPYFTSEQLYEEALDKAEVRLEEAILEAGETS